ncbi:MAG: hypothetical protein ABI321_04545 [Polyangia bacterium]
MTVLRSFVLVAMLSFIGGACGGTGGGGGTFEPLLGIQGPQIWTLGFDKASHPVVGGQGGVWRYTEVDGWLRLGTVEQATTIFDLFPADDGGHYVVDGSTLYKIDLGASTWTTVKTYATSADATHTQVKLVVGDGTMYGVQSGGTQVPVYWPASGTGWIPVPNPPDQFGSNPLISNAAHDVYFFVAGANITRRDTSNHDSVFVDCHTKELLQCSLTLYPLRVLADGTLYFFSRQPTAERIYKVPAGGGTPTLVAALPSGDPPNDYLYADDFSVADNGTAYITGKRSDDAYSYGSTFRFSGSTKGTMILASPTDFDAPSSVTTAPDANIRVSPDNTLYSVLSVQGGVARFHH